MRITDMQQRESFDTIVIDTLSKGWSEQYGNEISLDYHRVDQGMLWLVQPLLNAFFVQTIGLKARHFLRDSFRYTPVIWKIPGQFLLGTLLSSTVGLRLFSKKGFRVSQNIPHQSNCIVAPGNQRIRVFDFESGLCRVFLKHGFDNRTMLREIQLRSRGVAGPFPRILAWSKDGTWFEEQIIEAFALPRCPISYDGLRFEQEALRCLDEWLAQSTFEVKIETRLNALDTEIQDRVEALRAKLGLKIYTMLISCVKVLMKKALNLGVIHLADTHGDFQPGNVLVEKNSGKVLLIDWEHCQTRYGFYDYFVYGLRSRSPLNLADRLSGFAAGNYTNNALNHMPSDRMWRLSTLALFLLEDLNWYLAENMSGPYYAITEGLKLYCKELSKLGLHLEKLFGQAYP